MNAAQQMTPPQIRALEWSPVAGQQNTWNLVMFPFVLVMEYSLRDQRFYGHIKGSFYTLRGDPTQQGWATIEEAAKGMIEWGLNELLMSYQELAKLNQ